MLRRTLIKALGALAAVVLCKVPVMAKVDIPKPDNICNLDDLNAWIASWQRAIFQSTVATELAPSGRTIRHREYGLGAVVNLDALIKREHGEAHADMLDYVRGQSEIKKALYRVVANSIYEVVSEGGAVCWRILPEEDVALYFNFVPDEDGPDVDFITDRKGYRSVAYGSLKTYWRFSVDNERHDVTNNSPTGYPALGYKKDGENIRFLHELKSL